MFVDIDDDTVSALSYQQQASSLDGNTDGTNNKSFDVKSILSSETFARDAVEEGEGSQPLPSGTSLQMGDGDLTIKSKRMVLTKLQSVSSIIKF